MKDKILHAAIKILHEGGIKKLSQPEVCRILGIRQSQLTYYFPRRYDLIESIVAEFTKNAQASLDRIGQSGDSKTVIRLLEMQMTRPGPMRGFLGLLIEADQDSTVAKLMREHMKDFEDSLVERLNHIFSRAQTLFLLEHLRGIGLTRFSRPGYDSSESLKLIENTLEPKPSRKKDKKNEGSK